MKDRSKKSKKKKKKIWLYVLSGFLLIILGLGGYIIYELKIKQYDVADPVVDELIEENYVIQLPDGSELVIDKEGNIVEEKPAESNAESTTANNTNSQTNESTENTNTGDTNTSNTNNQNQGATAGKDNKSQDKPTTNQPTEEKPTVATIKAKYMPTLEALEAQAETKINGLISQAKKEYSTKKSNGESISFGYFYNKYMGAADALEASTDAAFNSLIKVIENDFERNGFSKDHASSFRDEYNATKETRRSNLLKKALEVL
ncbi:hypothetical protein ACOQFO_02240 [Ureibacillus sp. MALMAid1270]|uniref:hypothetical protein n=1 Tax=Ureibacillus sp. MALMAid1270 TaxID=3411629 RepID=UPI003BA7D4BF